MSLLVVQGREAPTVLVRSTANPVAPLLLFVRGVLQRDTDLRALFVQFKAEHKSVEWLRDMLVTRVFVRADGHSFDEVADACQYLADEYHQLACLPGAPLEEGVFLVDKETGRVQLVVAEGDLHDPGVLPRESGIMGQALPRLSPALETALVTGRHERAREGDTVSSLVARSHQTDLLRDEGDGRLRVASRAGRTSLAKELSEDDPSELLWRAGGTAGMFLRRFTREVSTDTTCLVRIEGVARSRSVLGIQDMRTINLGYNRLGALRSVAPQAWVRDIARQLSFRAKEQAGSIVPLNVDCVRDQLFASQELWVSDPDIFSLLGSAKTKVFPVESADTIGMSGCVGSLSVSSNFGVQTRELSDRWEVTATVPYTIYVDLRKVQVLSIVGIARASSVEPS